MSEPDQAELFTNPSRLLSDARRAKQEERERLGRIFAPPPKPAEDEATLDELADVVAERILEKLVPEPEPEPQGGTAGGFDGGARANVQGPPESHNQWLTRVLRERRADVGADL
jgi:hypothetical protein